MNFLHRFIRDDSGLSAIEFAYVLPIMLVLLVGGVQITNALEVNKKVSLAASSVSDLVAQGKTLNNAQRDDVFSAADSLLVPFDPGTLQVVVSSLSYVDDTTGNVEWSEANSRAKPHAQNDKIKVPSGVLTSGTTVIMAEVVYQYNNPLSGIKIMMTGGGSYSGQGTFNMSDKFFDRPRLSVAVARTP